MIREMDRLQHAISEYGALVDTAGDGARPGRSDPNWRRLEELLADAADWTPRGAATVLYLAREYGSFVLRNALGLAVALRVEDGEAGL